MREELTPEEYDNLANVAIYNLTKRKALYNEVSSEFSELAKIGFNVKVFKFFIIYSYTPFYYLAAASIFQLMKRRIAAVDMFVHATIFLAINQY